MDDGFRDFFRQVPPLKVREPLAETLGAVREGTEITYSFADLVKLAGHACPTMAGAWLACEAALRELHGSEAPVRGNIAVTVHGEPDEGAYGVIAAAFTLLTGAAPATGFKGIGPRFKRKDLLLFDGRGTQPGRLCFEFRRVDSGQCVRVTFTPRAVPFAEEKARRLGALTEKVAWEAARPEELAEFRELWMEKVRTMLVERRGIADWLNVGERSA